MKTQETVQRLQAVLSQRGVTGRQPKPEEVWSAFKVFAAEPVDCEYGFVMVQVGDSAVMGDSYLDFCREFSLRDADGNGWTEQVHAEFKTVLPAKLGHKQTDCSSYNFPDLASFFAAVEEMPEFQAGLSFPDWSFNIYHTEV